MSRAPFRIARGSFFDLHRDDGLDSIALAMYARRQRQNQGQRRPHAQLPVYLDFY
ncbi:MAG: hypothetical protein GX161_01035 [Firmicutes bacterium]|nr:hypothetical protein [Bacillota bacterium]